MIVGSGRVELLGAEDTLILGASGTLIVGIDGPSPTEIVGIGGFAEL